ncbi:hypothetical protein VUR80DRAFT_1245 [Thermomyces stellatus]
MTPLLVSLVGIFSAATLGLAAPVNELALANLPRSPAKELTLELCEAAARYGFVPYMIECRGINKRGEPGSGAVTRSPSPFDSPEEICEVARRVGLKFRGCELYDKRDAPQIEPQHVGLEAPEDGNGEVYSAS